MKRILPYIFLFYCVARTCATYAQQTGEIRVRFLGNCGVYMTDGKQNVYVDFPYKSGAYGYMKYDQSAIDSIKDDATFIFTHKHADHYSGKLVRRVDGRVYTPWKGKKLRKLNDPMKDFSVQTFRTKHMFSFKHNSYLITWHGKKMYFSGDTVDPETIGTMHDMDWAFVPSWIVFNAREKHINIDAKHFAIYHLYPNEQLNVVTPGIVLMDKQGEVITVPY